MASKSLKQKVLLVVLLGLIFVGGKEIYDSRSAQRRAQSRRNNDDLTKLSVTIVQQRLNEYRIHLGRYPSTAEGLSALLNRPVNSDAWQGPYLEVKYTKDAWGQDYHYELNDGQYALTSLGPDGEYGTKDDLKADTPWWSPYP